MKSKLFAVAFFFSLAIGPIVKGEIVYQTDFSTDPEWTTNNPARYYWDPVMESYYQMQVNDTDGYAYKTVTGLSSGLRWKLEADVKPVSNDWAAGTGLRLWDSNMDWYNSNFFGLEFHITDEGRIPFLMWATSDQGPCHHPFNGCTFEYDIWYRALVEWNPETSKLYASVVRKDNGELLGERTVDVIGNFNGIDRVAVSSINHVYASGATAEGYLDNILVTQIPEPISFLFLSLGGMAAMRKRKA